MKRVLVLVEGQTEEAFLKRTVHPHLRLRNIHVTPTLLKTKRTASGPDHAGGVSKWSKIEKDLRLLLHDSDAVCVSTMLDYYGLPSDSPGWASRPRNGSMADVVHVEAAIASHIADSRLRPNLVLHEFEALLFAAPVVAATELADPHLEGVLADAVQKAGGPELVNDDPSTCPSRRIAAVVPGYSKTTDGPTIADAIGLARLRSVCPHFDEWISYLESV